MSSFTQKHARIPQLWVQEIAKGHPARADGSDRRLGPVNEPQAVEAVDFRAAEHCVLLAGSV